MLKASAALALFGALTFGGTTASLADAGHSHAAGTQREGAAMSFGKTGDPAKVTRTITVVATEIAFDHKMIEAKVGETIRFRLVNRGEQDHEFTIADAMNQAEHREMMAKMPNMDHSQMAGHGHVMHGNSISVKPGETKELIWQFTEAGTFEFACNFPGHAEVGMAGPLIVK